MNALLSGDITSVAEFLAHALELEVESAERYDDMADNMEVHNNPGVAELFRQLAKYGKQHADAVRQQASAYDLPAISPWDFKWNCPEGPESPCEDDMNYLMNKCDALQVALHNEQRGRDFYVEVARSTPSFDVQRIAAEMAEEENSHVEMLKEWIAREACDFQPAVDDLDPPNMPE